MVLDVLVAIGLLVDVVVLALVRDGMKVVL